MGAWLQHRDASSPAEYDGEHRRFARARVVLLGWLPLAIVMFWLALILTKGIVFSNEASAPRYAISASGTTIKPVLVSIAGEPAGLFLDIGIPLGTRVVTVANVGDGSPCRWLGSPARSNWKSMTYSDIYDQKKLVGQNVSIAVPTGADAFDDSVVYGFYTKMLFVHCDVEWRPIQRSYAKYSLDVVNGYDPDPRGLRQALALSAYQLNDSRLITFAGKRTAQEDERILVPRDDADVEWKPENGAEQRDALFVVIGAFVAIGAAILIEALRPLVELAIESNYAAGSGDRGPEP